MDAHRTELTTRGGVRVTRTAGPFDPAELGRIARECVRLSAEGGGPELVRLISEFDTVLFGEVSNRRIRAILGQAAQAPRAAKPAPPTKPASEPKEQP